MTEISSIDLLVLILLEEGATHGYQIDQVLRMSHAREWVRIGASSVYQSLERLARKGFVEASVDASALPARRTYAVTDEGRQTLRAQAETCLTEGESVYLNVNVGLAAYAYLEPSVVRSRLGQRRAELTAMIAEAEVYSEPAVDGAQPHRRWIREHVIHMLQAEVEWTDKVLAEMQGHIAEGC